MTNNFLNFIQGTPADHIVTRGGGVAEEDATTLTTKKRARTSISSFLPSTLKRSTSGERRTKAEKVKNNKID